MENENTIIQDRVKFLLQKNNFSSKRLAEESGLTPSAISQIINDGKMTLKSARQIAKVFNTSIDFLFGTSDIENPNEYAFEILLNHVHSLTTQSFWNGSPIAWSISISEEFAQFLETTIDISRMQMPDDLRDEWLKRERESFVMTIGKEPSKKRKYVLIDHNFYTPEVENLVESLKCKMTGSKSESQ